MIVPMALIAKSHNVFRNSWTTFTYINYMMPLCVFTILATNHADVTISLFCFFLSFYVACSVIPPCIFTAQYHTDLPVSAASPSPNQQFLLPILYSRLKRKKHIEPRHTFCQSGLFDRSEPHKLLCLWVHF